MQTQVCITDMSQRHCHRAKYTLLAFLKRELVKDGYWALYYRTTGHYWLSKHQRQGRGVPRGRKSGYATCKWRSLHFTVHTHMHTQGLIIPITAHEVVTPHSGEDTTTKILCQSSATSAQVLPTHKKDVHQDK